MLTGLSADLQDIKDVRKTAVINDELKRLDVDVATLQETRLADAGTLREKEYTFFWQGKGSDERREHGVGFAVKNTLLKSICLGTNGSERILTLRLNTTRGPATIVSVYAPTLAASPEEKDMFYGNLSASIRDIPNSEQLFLLGDFNARVGADHNSWPLNLGSFGVGTMNENGQRLLEFCTSHNLVVTNSFFKTKPQHKVSWCHPRSKQWHQLDLILARITSLVDVTHSRSYHSADCDTDHSLVCCKIKLHPKRFHRKKQLGKPRIDTTKMTQPELVLQFSSSLEKHLAELPSAESATVKWENLRDTIHSTALSTFGRKTSKLCDWFDAKAYIMTPVIEAKRTALAHHKAFSSTESLSALRNARRKVQQTARRCANEYWTELSQDIQVAAITGNIRGMYDGIKKAFGPT